VEKGFIYSDMEFWPAATLHPRPTFNRNWMLNSYARMGGFRCTPEARRRR
jgi:hypothetical protein